MNATTNMLKSRSTVHKPGRLKRGGRIGVLATAGIVEPKSLEAGIAAIRAEGFEVELSKRIFDGKGYLAGEPKERATELVDFFRRSDIDAILSDIDERLGLEIKAIRSQINTLLGIAIAVLTVLTIAAVLSTFYIWQQRQRWRLYQFRKIADHST